MPKPTKPSDQAALRSKAVGCSFKALDDDYEHGSFELYAAAFGNVDRQGDIIDPGAVMNLDEFVADGFGLINHDMRSLPIAYVVSAVQDAKGVKVVGRFHSDPEAQRVRAVVRERMEAGKSVKCSIGFRVVDGASETIGGRTIYRIKSLLLYEFSFVNIPANPNAGVVGVKSEAPMHEPDEKVGVIQSVKEWLGLSTKKGRALSRANHAALKSFADMMAEHGAKGDDHVKGLAGLAKGLKEHGESCKTLAAAMHKHLSAFDPEADDEPEGDDDGPEETPPAAAKDAGPSEEDRRKILKLRAAQHRRAADAA